jgi:hypothetical protein
MRTTGAYLLLLQVPSPESEFSGVGSPGVMPSPVLVRVACGYTLVSNSSRTRAKLFVHHRRIQRLPNFP